MKVISLDPGTATGVVIAVVKPKSQSIHVIDWDEVILDEGDPINSFNKLRGKVQLARPDRDTLGLIEKVVKSGHMSTDKFNQITAYNQATLALREKDIPVVEIAPDVNKSVTETVPSDIKSKHAKDAYRLILAHMRKEDG